MRTLTLALILTAAASIAPAEAFQLPVSDEIVGNLQDTANLGLTSRIIQIFVLVSVLSIAPGIAMMVTCLPFILIVFSILRQGVGLQQAPPNMLIVSVALFLTYFIMEPVFSEAWRAGVEPMLSHELSEDAAIEKTIAPFREFMMARVNVDAMEILNDARTSDVLADPANPPLSLLVPSFVLSEIQRAFQVGFVILLPFLIIDLLVASILTAMGMIMVPPAIVSLPFKLSFFVLTNGWVTVSAALVRGYS